jgi:TetR/AcrR family transcriptional repressor of nem operon
MTRQREFDRELVLQRAMDHFWEHGYEATSLRDLLDAMQIGRQSLYDTFGDKHTLFLTCLEHYRQMAVRTLLAPLCAPDGGLAAIEDYFASAARGLGSEPHRACLIVNSCVELGPHDTEAAAITNRFVRDLQRAFANALRIAASQGQVQVDDVNAVGWRLTNAALGLVPLSKAGTPPRVLKLIAAQVLDTL